MPDRQFDFYGVGVVVESLEEGFQASVEHDFSYFLSRAPSPDIRLTFQKNHPDFKRIDLRIFPKFLLHTGEDTFLRIFPT